MGGEGINKPYSYDITYGGIVGAVLYPDDYTGPALSGTVNTLPEGVVFLPSAVYRYGFKVGNLHITHNLLLPSSTPAKI